MTDRAVSHLVGFVLIFGIIMLGATTALVVGEDHLDDVRDHEQTVNAERAMTLVGQNLNGLAYSRSASTVGTLNLNDGQLRKGNVSNVSVRISNSRPTDSTWTVPMGSLVYEVDDTQVRYESGMLIRSDRGNGVALSAHHLTCSGDRAIVSITTLNGSDGRQLGSGRVSIEAFENRTHLLYPINRSGLDAASDATSVTVNLRNSTHSDVWNSTLDDSQWTPTGDEYQCDVGADGEVYLRQTIIDVDFQR